MYEMILDYIFAEFERRTPQQQKQFLEALQGTARELRSSYQTQNVQTDYTTRETQSVYTLRYYLSYSQLIQTVLQKVDLSYLKCTDYLEAAFFGAGPAPELLGLLQHLRACLPDVLMFTAHLYDIAIEEWAFSRNITVNTLVPHVWQHGLFEARCAHIDIRQTNALSPLDIVARGCQFVVFQNCLNELGPIGQANVGASIINVFDNLTPNGLLVIIDRYGYQSVQELIEHVARSISRTGRVLFREPAVYDSRPINARIPYQVRTHLFYGIHSSIPGHDGLVLAKEVRYQSLVVQKL